MWVQKWNEAALLGVPPRQQQASSTIKEPCLGMAAGWVCPLGTSPHQLPQSSLRTFLLSFFPHLGRSRRRAATRQLDSRSTGHKPHCSPTVGGWRTWLSWQASAIRGSHIYCLKEQAERLTAS